MLEKNAGTQDLGPPRLYKNNGTHELGPPKHYKNSGTQVSGSRKIVVRTTQGLKK